MRAIEKRLQALEAPPDRDGKPLPDVVADDTPNAELERLRRGGREVYRMSDAVELFVCAPD